MSEQDPEVAAALKIQRDGRARANARGRALRRLKEAHPEEYARYYAEERGEEPEPVKIAEHFHPGEYYGCREDHREDHRP